MTKKNTLMFTVDGEAVTAGQGQTIAEAMLSAGMYRCRTTKNGEERGIFCCMGVCHECRMIVGGVPNVRSCMTPAYQGCIVETQDDTKL